MNHYIILLFILLATPLIAQNAYQLDTIYNPAQGEANENRAQDRQAILKTIDNLNQGWDSRNVELAIQDYAENIDWTNAFGDRVQGKEALRELLTNIFKLDFVMAGKQNYVENDIEFLSDDIALVRSKNLREEQQLSDGSAMGTRDINHLRVYKKIDGRWLIVSHMISQAHQKR